MALLGKERVENDAGYYKVRLAGIIETGQQKFLRTDVEIWKLVEIQERVDGIFYILLEINKKKKCICYLCFYRWQIIC